MLRYFNCDQKSAPADQPPAASVVKMYKEYKINC